MPGSPDHRRSSRVDVHRTTAFRTHPEATTRTFPEFVRIALALVSLPEHSDSALAESAAPRTAESITEGGLTSNPASWT